MKTTNERIDHAAEAKKILEDLEPHRGQHLELDPQLAQVHATLALVEQQRIANLIELGEQWEDTGNPALDSVAPQLRPEIEEALGL